MSKTFPNGSVVAWQFVDGRTVTGTVIDRAYDTYLVRRTDGGVCNLTESAPALRFASVGDVAEAVYTFSRLGQ